MGADRRLRLSASVLVLAISGCVALPYASPPMKVRAGGGAVIPLPSLSPGSAPGRTGGVFDLSIAVHPRQLFDPTFERIFDIGFGYHLLVPGRGVASHAPFVETSALIALNDARTWRAVVHVAPELVYRPKEWGPGATFGAGVELVAFADWVPTQSTDSKGFSVGVAHGEGGVGIDLSTTLRSFPSGWDLSVILAFTARAPASAGIFFAWVWSLL